MTHYIVISEKEIVKAEMERPSFSAWEMISPAVDKVSIISSFVDHCLSLPRILIEGEHKWKLWQEVVDGKDFRWQHQMTTHKIEVWYDCTIGAYNNTVDESRRIVAIPIQPTPEGEKEATHTIDKMAKIIQEECHLTVEYIVKKAQAPKTYQDATNVFLFRKLAELQLRINQLEESQQAPTHQR